MRAERHLRQRCLEHAAGSPQAFPHSSARLQRFRLALQSCLNGAWSNRRVWRPGEQANSPWRAAAAVAPLPAAAGTVNSGPRCSVRATMGGSRHRRRAPPAATRIGAPAEHQQVGAEGWSRRRSKTSVSFLAAPRSSASLRGRAQAADPLGKQPVLGRGSPPAGCDGSAKHQQCSSRACIVHT